jgi:hypothetical protein
MKIKITLSGAGGVLDRRELDTGDDDSAEVSAAIWSTLDDACWILEPGDTIKITKE